MGGSVALLMLFGFPFMHLLAHQPLLLWAAFSFQRLLDVISGLSLSLSLSLSYPRACCCRHRPDDGLRPAAHQRLRCAQ